jgi:peptidoglycan/LPS O-acetylase OafA/YrhL
MKPNPKTKGRLLFIDVLRISGLTLILLHHLIGTKLVPSWFQDIPSNYVNKFSPYLFSIDYGSIGVWLFIFASGCSLALSDTDFSSFSKVINFYKKRFIRIYPTYWVALIFNFFIFSWLMPSFTIIDILKWFSGFQVYLATNWWWPGKLNITYWFIGVILALYLLYPLILYVMQKHPNISLISFFFISLASRWIVYYLFPNISGGWISFPLGRLFNFGLGIYIIQRGHFPRAISNRAVAFISVMTFYLYLLEYPLYCVANFYGGIFYFIAGMAVFSFLLYLFDNFVKNLSLKRSRTLTERTTS